VRGWFWVSARHGWLRGLNAIKPAREKIPLRTLFNSRTQEYEEVRLTVFQQLLMQGRIQETVKRGQDGPPQRVYLLV